MRHARCARCKITIKQIEDVGRLVVVIPSGHPEERENYTAPVWGVWAPHLDGAEIFVSLQ